MNHPNDASPSSAGDRPLTWRTKVILGIAWLIVSAVSGLIARSAGWTALVQVLGNWMLFIAGVPYWIDVALIVERPFSSGGATGLRSRTGDSIAKPRSAALCNSRSGQYPGSGDVLRYKGDLDTALPHFATAPVGSGRVGSQSLGRLRLSGRKDAPALRYARGHPI